MGHIRNRAVFYQQVVARERHSLLLAPVSKEQISSCTFYIALELGTCETKLLRLYIRQEECCKYSQYSHQCQQSRPPQQLANTGLSELEMGKTGVRYQNRPQTQKEIVEIIVSQVACKKSSRRQTSTTRTRKKRALHFGSKYSVCDWPPLGPIIGIMAAITISAPNPLVITALRYLIKHVLSFIRPLSGTPGR